MPIYEYRCRDCDETFELLVRGSSPSPECPECEGDSVERVLTVPRLKTEATHDMAMRAAKKRDKKQARDRMHERIRYEESHDRHG